MFYYLGGVTVTEHDGSSWVFCIPNEGRNVLLLTSSGTREGDNVVFVREPGNLFDASCVKVGLSWDRCIYTFLVIYRPELRLL